MTDFLKNLRQLSATLKTLARTVPLLWRVEPRGLALLTLTLSAQGFLPALTLFLTRWTINQVAALANHTGTMPVALLGLSWLVLLLLDPVLNVCAQLLQGDLAEKFTLTINRTLMQKIETLQGLDVLEDPQLHDTLSLLQGDAERRPMNLVSLLTLTARDLLSVVLVSLALLPLAWWAPLALLLATFPHTVATLRLREMSFSALLSNTPEGRAMAYDSRVAMSRPFAQEVRLFGLFSWLRSRYETRFFRVNSAMRQVRQREATQVLPSSLLAILVSTALFTWAVWQASRGLFSLGQTVIVIQALIQVSFATRDIVIYLGMIYERALFFERYFAFLELEPGVRQPENPVRLPARPAHSVTFDNVSFAYPDGRVALQEVSFHVPAGQTVAVVGENGAGKTTLVNLLLRFYDPSEGRILVGDTDLRDLDLEAWRQSVGAIFQTFNRYDYSVRENVALGNLAAQNDTERIESALRLATLDLPSNLPAGIETQLGKEFGGTELSGGQWQKLATARVILRDATVLILDEPTAALDPRSEHTLYTQFASLASAPTTFLITHRLSSVLMADRILVLQGGRLIEDGTHKSLLEASGEYAQLWTLQAKRYTE